MVYAVVVMLQASNAREICRHAGADVAGTGYGYTGKRPYKDCGIAEWLRLLTYRMYQRAFHSPAPHEGG
jgi:hypothetical protein